jgi:hypothetical protein
MNERGQGPDWTVEGEDDETIDSEWEYEVIPFEVEKPVKIFLKQEELEVMPSLSWISLSDQLVKKWRLPKGSLLRIYPVTGSVENQDAKIRSAVPRSPSAGNLVKDEGNPDTRSRAVPGPSSPKPRKSKKASTRTADDPQPTMEQQAPIQPVKGQESPEAKASHPMETRRQASRAGGSRPGGGSGQKDTCVAQGNPSKT